MNKLFEFKLKVLKEFQDKHPTSHVGGSIGLMLRGIDLQRDLMDSDLDITVDEYVFTEDNVDGLEQRSDGNDFDYCVKRIDNDLYTKIDIRVNPEPSFETVSYDGVSYNVSKVRDILFWKKKYAKKGVLKHVNDLITIETGVRPKEVEDEWFF